ncbi:hypothetical protein BDD12DRAFT_848144, partial [Trichophaea hybrida]
MKLFVVMGLFATSALAAFQCDAARNCEAGWWRRDWNGCKLSAREFRRIRRRI